MGGKDGPAERKTSYRVTSSRAEKSEAGTLEMWKMSGKQNLMLRSEGRHTEAEAQNWGEGGGGAQTCGSGGGRMGAGNAQEGGSGCL